MSKTFFIIGPEGAGTYMMRDVLVKAGCFWDPRTDSIDFDWENQFTGVPSPQFVLRRSLPHAGKWEDMEKLVSHLAKIFDEIWFLLMIREYHSACLSVKNRDNTRISATLHHNYLEGLISWISPDDRSLIPISYDYFVLSEPYRRWLFKYRFELYYPEDFIFYDGNQKYFAEFDERHE